MIPMCVVRYDGPRLRRVTEDDDFRLIRTSIGRGPDEWRSAVDAVLELVAKEDRQRIQAIRAAVLVAREDVQRALATTPQTEWSAARRTSLLAEMDRRIAQLEAQLRSEVEAGVEDAARLGQRAVKDPLKAYAPRLSMPAGADVIVPTLDLKAVALAQETAGDLVKGLTDDLRAAITTEVNRAILGDATPYEVAQRIAGELDRDGAPGRGPFQSTWARGQIIARTEINGAFSRSNNDTIATVARKLPSLFLKKWVSVGDSRTRPEHVRLGGLPPIPASQKFEVQTSQGVVLADGPHDPALPPDQTVACRCTTALLPAPAG